MTHARIEEYTQQLDTELRPVLRAALQQRLIEAKHIRRAIWKLTQAQPVIRLV